MLVNSVTAQLKCKYNQYAKCKQNLMVPQQLNMKLPRLSILSVLC